MQRGTPDFPMEFYHITENHPRYQMQMHWHSDFEIIRVLSGRIKLCLNEYIYDFEADDSVLIPGGIVHGAVAENCVYECIVFSPSLLYVSGKCRDTVKHGVVNSSLYKKNITVDSIFKAVSEKKRGYEFEFLSGVYSLIRDIAYNAPAVKSGIKNGKYEKIKAALSIIEENYNTQFTLDFLAKSCGMSPNYFCRFFKQMTQKTPFDYINIYRINAACEMLSDGNASVTDIAYNCGYNDLSYFIKMFKKYKGMSPKNYVKSLEKAD